MPKRIKIIIAFFSFLGLFGCTEQTKPATGSIHVEITGLPAHKTVMLSSPGYSKTLTGSSTVNNLEPGRYIINAPTFTIDSVKFKASISKTPIPVVAGQTAFVSVKYSSEKLYRLNVSVSGMGRITSSDGKIACGIGMNRCSFDYNKDTKVVLNARESAQSRFLHWNKEDENSKQISLIMDKDQSQKAFFEKLSKADLAQLNPKSFKLTAQTDQKRSASFSFANEGSETLNYKVSSEQSWLSLPIKTGSLEPEKSQTIDFSTQCGKDEVKLSGKILIESNDPYQGKIEIPVELSCQKAPKEFELKLTVSGKGSVSSKDGKINCSEEKTEKCSAKYPESSELILEAKAAEGSKFATWKGDVSSDKENLRILLSKDMSVEASFEKEQKPAEISKIQPEKLYLKATVNDSTTKQLSFKNTGEQNLEYSLSDSYSWLTESPLDGVLKPGETGRIAVKASCGKQTGAYRAFIIFTTNDKNNEQLNYEVNLMCQSLPLDKYPLNIYVDGPGKVSSDDGKIDCSNDGGKCSYDYEIGSSVSLTATPNADAGFVSWSQDASGVDKTIDLKIEKTTNISAEFAATNGKIMLRLSVNGAGKVTSTDGKINCGGSNNNCSAEYEKDAIVNLHPVPDSGESFQSWGGDCSGTGDCKITMSKTKTVSATFSQSQPDDKYHISFVLLGDANKSSKRQVFENAAEKWMSIISKNPSKEKIDLAANEACHYGEDAIKTEVDGLLIVASIVPIDGKGGILGQAGPRYLRDGGLPYVGCMQFDEADIGSMEANGSLSSVILHEMGHVIGIGTLWKYLGHMNGYKPTTACNSSIEEFTVKPAFTGKEAITEYATLGGHGNVPVEDKGGQGTRCGHWSEATFGNELMTGWANAGAMPLSRMTVASLFDLGYEVNKNAADDYHLPDSNIIESSSFSSFPINEQLIFPEYKLTKNGKIRKLDELK